MSINLNRFNRVNRKKIFNRIERTYKTAIPQAPKRPPLLHPQLDISALTDIFLSKFSASSSTYQSIDCISLVPQLVLQYTELNNTNKTLVTNLQSILTLDKKPLDWSETLTLSTPPATGEQAVGLSYATTAIAETGSLVLCASKQNPTTVNFLTDHHIIILREQDIVPNIESMWEKLSLSAECMPRAVNIITGPSRTADIEQTIQLGAHGPRSLHLLLLTGN
ncbi:MAG: LUD domain-containing protein [Pseudomonadales bacterium]|nr:LUD domain-containing protein [Pseudomonadales bacterium]